MQLSESMFHGRYKNPHTSVGMGIFDVGRNLQIYPKAGSKNMPALLFFGSVYKNMNLFCIYD